MGVRGWFPNPQPPIPNPYSYAGAFPPLGSGIVAGFVAHHSCGTVAASHRLPRPTIQIGKQQVRLSSLTVHSDCEHFG